MSTPGDRYGKDVLAQASARKSGTVPSQAAELGIIVEDASSSFVGAVVATGKDGFTLEDREGRRRVFDWLSATMAVEGRLVRLTPPVVEVAPTREIRSASGSTYVAGLNARTAQPSRILVEGLHDAALVEKVWGHDLRVDGIVVELLDGADNLPAFVKDFQPSRDRRLGVLLDHLTLGSKESRIADQVSGPHVKVTGHPYIDIWQAIKPSVAGITEWPSIPRGQGWKTEVCNQLGWPGSGEAWQHLLSKVHSWKDLESPLINAVEQLVDFVTVS